MALHRIKQFYWAVTSPLKKIDNDYIQKHLNEEEISLFSRLKMGEKLHCIRVAKEAEAYYDRIINEGKQLSFSRESIIKLSLLHDIGKIKEPLNVIEKSIIVVLHKLTKGGLKKYSNNKKIYIYYYHPKEGKELLEKFNYSEAFIKAVENHHSSKYAYENTMMQILKYADNIS